MKKKSLKIYMLLCCLSFLIACDDDKLPKDLKDTQWQLIEMVNVETGEKTTPEPEICAENDFCFNLTIDADGMAHICLEVVTFDLDLMSPDVGVICQKIGYPFTGNGELFRSALCLFDEFKRENDNIRLYCNDNKTYLLFKQIEK
jgi:hypothetical protein